MIATELNEHYQCTQVPDIDAVIPAGPNDDLRGSEPLRLNRVIMNGLSTSRETKVHKHWPSNIVWLKTKIVARKIYCSIVAILLRQRVL